MVEMKIEILTVLPRGVSSTDVANEKEGFVDS